MTSVWASSRWFPMPERTVTQFHARWCDRYDDVALIVHMALAEAGFPVDLEVLGDDFFGCGRPHYNPTLPGPWRISPSAHRAVIRASELAMPPEMFADWIADKGVAA